MMILTKPDHEPEEKPTLFGYPVDFVDKLEGENEPIVLSDPPMAVRIDLRTGDVGLAL